MMTEKTVRDIRRRTRKKNSVEDNIRFGNGLLALEAALSGQGILPGCKNLLTSELTSGKLEILTGHTIQCATAYYVVSAGSSNERPIAKQFRQWLIDESQGKV